MKDLTSEYLKRENTFFGMIGTILPDPDKILAQNGNDLSIYRDLLIDPHLTATVLQRKMQVLQMGWEVESENENLRKEGIEIMRNLPMQNIMSQMLDSILYGFSVSEVIWGKKAGKIIPVQIVSKPQEWFAFDNDNELKIINGSKEKNEVINLPSYKFLLAQHQPTFDNPYGERILSRCYWPVKLKQSSIESWVQMIEKFGVPYLIGVVSDTATDTEKEAVIDDLLEMIENNVATRGVSEVIEIKDRATYDVGQMFEKMVEFQNKEISKAVLSVTLTVDVSTTGSFKASDVHRQMLEYIGISDKKIIEGEMNQLFDYYTELNYGKSSEKIRIKLTKKESITEETAQRDKILSEIGIKFNKGYFMKRYNLGDEDFEISDIKESQGGCVGEM